MQPKEDLLTDLGENYEYVRRIVHNTIEIKKIDYSENVSQIFGNAIAYLILSMLISCVLVLGLVMGIIYLTHALDSVYGAIGCAIVFIILVMLAIWKFKSRLFIRPLLRSLYSKLEADE